MASFEVKVVRIDNIIPIENADKIELAQIGGYMSVIQKGQFHKGQLVAYIPEDSVLPDYLLAEMGLTGKLAGSGKNRVKAIKLRGQLSQGLILNAGSIWAEGDNVAEFFGITKYEPPVPIHMEGQVTSEYRSSLVRYDIENIKKYPDIFQEGEEVVLTEKIHGTFCEVMVVDGQLVVTSKGMADKGLSLKINEENKGNLYVRTIQQASWLPRLMEVENSHLILFGEIAGRGVQDLHYTGEVIFRLFDIATRTPDGTPQFFTPNAMTTAADWLGIPTVPAVYHGPYSWGTVQLLSKGKSILADHIREGVVIRPIANRDHPAIGRVILKSVSGDYLLRKDGTEYN